jgi:hypothetical protein
MVNEIEAIQVADKDRQAIDKAIKTIKKTVQLSKNQVATNRAIESQEQGTLGIASLLVLGESRSRLESTPTPTPGVETRVGQISIFFDSSLTRVDQSLVTCIYYLSTYSVLVF